MRVFVALAVLVVCLFPLTSAGKDLGQGSAPTRATYVQDGNQLPCQPIDFSGRYVRGGCVVKASSSEFDFGVRTAFGRLPFAYDCTFAFHLHLARDGRTWMDPLRIGGRGGCGDVEPCEPNALERSRFDKLGPLKGNADYHPWRGVLRPDGRNRFVNEMQICVDTCAGKYDGELELLLERRGRGWVVRADDVPVGAAGLTFDGTMPLRGRFDLAPGSAGQADR